MTIKINTTGDAQWDGASANLNGEQGVIVSTYQGNYAKQVVTHHDGGPDTIDVVSNTPETLYDAQFPIYGAMFYGIPASVCTLSE